MSDVLSQAEIDALLSAISSGDLDAAAIQDEPLEVQVKPFDFERPSKFSKDQLRTLEMLHETFCRLAQNQLSAQLRTLVEITVVGADQVNYGEFVRSMPFPTLINIVSMEPLEGSALLEVNLPLTLSIIDRLVGGPGVYKGRARELTEIEIALARGLTDILLDGLTESWNTVTPLEFKYEAAEMNPQFAQVAAPGDIAVLISFEMRVGSSSGMLHLCVPHIMLEPVLGGLSAQSYYSSKRGEPSADLRQAIVSELGAVAVPVSVELGSTHLHVGDLLALAPGDVIPLDMTPGTDVFVRVGDRGTFLGQPGTRGKRLAVQITRQIDEPMQGARS
ncbi:MAG: flagellar motor switch protein FliM [Thermoleophilia bacterium]|nr:flagellar motor switch protein FliM [Thermoleophilia bacterium]